VVRRFTGPGTSAIHERYDTGYQFQLSMMPIQRTLQLYSGGSHIFGQYGKGMVFDTTVELAF
jgi:hypothetical protein